MRKLFSLTMALLLATIVGLSLADHQYVMSALWATLMIAFAKLTLRKD